MHSYHLMIGGCALFIFSLFMLSLLQTGEYYQVHALNDDPLARSDMSTGPPRSRFRGRARDRNRLRAKYRDHLSPFQQTKGPGNGTCDIGKSDITSTCNLASI